MTDPALIDLRTALAAARMTGSVVMVRVGTGVSVGVPPELVDELIALIDRRVKGTDPPADTGVDRELTTTQAAERLGISRRHLTGLLDAGLIPFHRVGTHRRLRLADIIRYREESETQIGRGGTPFADRPRRG